MSPISSSWQRSAEVVERCLAKLEGILYRVDMDEYTKTAAIQRLYCTWANAEEETLSTIGTALLASDYPRLWEDLTL